MCFGHSTSQPSVHEAKVSHTSIQFQPSGAEWDEIRSMGGPFGNTTSIKKTNFQLTFAKSRLENYHVNNACIQTVAAVGGSSIHAVSSSAE